LDTVSAAHMPDNASPRLDHLHYDTAEYYIVSDVILAGFGKGPPVWSSGQSSWLQIQRSRVRFPALPDIPEILDLERGLLSLVMITEELVE
jgi:hypothetical protein